MNVKFDLDLPRYAKWYLAWYPYRTRTQSRGQYDYVDRRTTFLFVCSGELPLIEECVGEVRITYTCGETYAIALQPRLDVCTGCSGGYTCDENGYPCIGCDEDECECDCEASCGKRGVWCRKCGDFMPDECADGDDGKGTCFRCFAP